MKLRWFVTCDKNGVKSKPELQFWNPIAKCWETPDYVEVKDWEYEEAMTRKPDVSLDEAIRGFFGGMG